TTLAVDMLALKDAFDVAVIISGDADMIPSISHLKRLGKQVMSIELVRGPTLDDRGRGFSTRMRMVADFVPRIYESDLLRERFAHRRAEVG
ncbi:MAG TPA: NYN domain-containing protein, partial [Myxococcota bacterium]